MTQGEAMGKGHGGKKRKWKVPLTSEQGKKGKAIAYTRVFEIKEVSGPLDKTEDLKKFYRAIGGDERGTAVPKPAGK